MTEDEDREAWKEAAEELGITMSSYYRAVQMALEEMYNSGKTPPNWLLDDLAPPFKPVLGTLKHWQTECLNDLIASHRFFRYHLEEDREMARFLTYRGGVEYVFMNGVWREEQVSHYHLEAPIPLPDPDKKPRRRKKDEGEGQE